MTMLEFIHKHTIMAIKGELDRYLVYYDPKWGCYLFPHCKDHLYYEDMIKDWALVKLDVVVKVRKGKRFGHAKYAPHDHAVNTYDHLIYLADTKREESDFTKDGVAYTWMTLEEMKQNNDIMKRNSDIVGFIEYMAKEE